MTPGKAVNRMLFGFRLRLERLPRDYFDLGTYPDSERPAFPRYLNIGALNFDHPLWHRLDKPTDWAPFSSRQQGNIDIAHDLTAGQPLPIATGTLAIAYCSHVIEHLRDDDVRLLFREAYRTLEPGGTLRIVAPDAQLFYGAYARGDHRAFRNALTLYRASSIEQRFLMQFATALVESHPERGPQTCSDEDVRTAFQTMSMEAFFGHFAARVPAHLQERYPGDHVNWFTAEKALHFLREAGFSHPRRSGHGQSCVPALRNRYLFDPYPDHSLYVECAR